MKNLFVLMLFLPFLFFMCVGFSCVEIPKQVIFLKAVLKVFLTPDIAWAPLKSRI